MNLQLHTEHVHRSYFAYGCRNHIVQLEVVNPTTTSTVIKAYDKITENIDATIFIQYSDDLVHRSRLGGSVELYTQAIKDTNSTGDLKNVTV